MPDRYCKTCHDWVEDTFTPSGRHEHQPTIMPAQGIWPKEGNVEAKVLEVMLAHQGWWSTWDLVPHCNSVHVRDFILKLKKLGWTFDERMDSTPDGKRYKSWKLVVPVQGGLF